MAPVRRSRVPQPQPSVQRPHASPSAQHLIHFEGGNALSRLSRPAHCCRACRPSATAHRRRVARATCTGCAATRRWTRAAHDKLAALLTLRRPCTGAGDGRAGRRDAAPGHRVALGLQGHRHRAQLRPGRAAASSASPNTALQLEERPAGRRQAADRRRSWQACAALLHDRMTESVAFDARGRAHLFDELARAPMEHVDVLGRRPRRAGAGQHASSAWR